MAPKYPAIPAPTTDSASLRDSVLSLKQGFEILTGQIGNGSAAAVVGGLSLGPGLTGSGKTINISVGHIPGSDGTTNPAAGEVGEYWTTAVGYSSAIPLSSGVSAVVAALTNLTPGDWDIFGLVNFEGVGGPVASYCTCFTDYGSGQQAYGAPLSATASDTSAYLTTTRVQITTNTTINLKANSAWSGGSGVKVWGSIAARRVI